MWPSGAHPPPKLLRSRCSRKPEVSGKREAWSKSSHKSLVPTIIQTSKGPNCWDSLPTGSSLPRWRTPCWNSNQSSEPYPQPKPESRPTSPRTRLCLAPNLPTKACASVSTFSLLHAAVSSSERRTELELGGHHDARGRRVLSMRVFQLFTTKSVPWNGRCWLGLRRIHRARGRGLGQQLFSRLLGILQNPVWQNAEIKGRHQADRERHSQSKRDRCDRDFLARFTHVHHDDNAKVVIGANGAVYDTDERQPNQVGFHRGAKDVKLGEETPSHGNTDERE